MTLKEAQDILEQFRKLTEHGACPSCGHCPSCGRGGVQFVPYTPPHNPWYPYTPYPATPWWSQGVIISTTDGAVTGNTITTTNVPGSWSYTVTNA